MSDQVLYISSNLIKAGQDEIVLDNSKALSLTSNSILSDSGIKFSIPSSGGLSFNGKGINTQNKNKSNQNLNVFPNKNNIGKNKDITVYIPSGINVSGILPDPPTNILAEKQGSNQIKVTFTPPEFTGGSPIKSYTAVFSNDNSKTETSTTSPITFSNLTLTLGNYYKIQVYSTNSSGNSQLSSESNSVLIATVPDSPTVSSITPGDKHVKLSFKDPEWNGGTPITSYKIYVNGILNKSITEKSYSVTGLTNGTSYKFQVSAINEIDESSLSDEISIIPGTPYAPNVVATLEMSAVSLKWFMPLNGSSSITAYKIYVSSNIYQSTQIIIVTQITTNFNEYITNLIPGNSYEFQVSAINMYGESLLSTKLFVKAVGKPSAPSIISSSAGSTSVSLSFFVQNNGGSPITSYKIYVKNYFNQLIRTLTTTDPNCVVTELSGGSRYYFQVSAINMYGESLLSNELSVTTRLFF
jgi:titin